MAYKIEWQHTAVADLQEIRTYLEALSVDAANRILTKIVDNTNDLAIFPARFPKLDGLFDFRRMVVEDYSIFYRIADQQNIVRIYHVFHHAKNPLSIIIRW